MGIEEERLTVWDINHPILAVIACLVETNTDLGDAREGEHEFGHGRIADGLRGLAQDQVGNILALEEGSRCQFGDALVEDPEAENQNGGNTNQGGNTSGGTNPGGGYNDSPIDDD